MGRRGAILSLGWLLPMLSITGIPAIRAQETPPPQTAAVDAPAPAPVEVLQEAAKEDRAAVLFMTKCAGCHTIGGGALSGPDLKTSSTYPRQTVLDAIKKMEKNVGPIGAEEVEILGDLVLDPSAPARIEEQRKLVQLRELATLEPGNAAKGRAFFLGKAAFSNGAVACAACHQASGRGGTLAASLEDAFTRLGEQSLASTTEKPGFPVMRAIYEAHPVTKQEARHVVAFLQEVAVSPAEKNSVAPMHLAGAVGAIGIMIAFGASTRRRAAGTRARMVAEAYSRANRGCRCGGK